MPVYTTRSAWEAAQGGGSWKQKYGVDWPAEFVSQGAHNFLLHGGFIDSAGKTWDIGGSTIIGSTNASAMDLGAAGLTTTTSANGDIIFGQLLVDLIGDYALSDRLAIIAEIASADHSVKYQNIWLQYGRGGSDWADGTHRIWRQYDDPGAVMKQKRKQLSPGSYDSANLQLAAAHYDVMGLDVSGDACHSTYYGSSVPASPWTGLTGGQPQGMLRDSDNPNDPFGLTEAAVSIYLNRNNASSTDFTVVWKSLTIWRWE